MSFFLPASPLSLHGTTQKAGQNVQDGPQTREQCSAALRQALKQTVVALSSLLTLCDLATAQHAQRTASLASALAREMGLNAARQEGLHWATLMHDIGQVQIPAEILTRPRQLSPEEFDLVKQHPAAGHQILCNIDFPWPVAKIVLQHHENFDGSGYPNRLQAEQILLEARIIRVADSCEAMLSHRPFRRAHAVSHVIEELQKEQGRAFDPDVAAACQRVLNEQDHHVFCDEKKHA